MRRRYLTASLPSQSSPWEATVLSYRSTQL